MPSPNQTTNAWRAAIAAAVVLTLAGPVRAQTSTRSGKLVHVEGNHFVTRDGQEMVFRGMAAPDPARLLDEGQWTPGYFATMRAWGANVVRLPVHPTMWRARGPAGCLRIIDQAIEWAARADLFVIVDWHIIGNPRTELAYEASYETSRKETLEFWRRVSERYADNPRVFLYEIYNEPTSRGGKLGELSWSDWKTLAEEIVRVIYAHDPGAIPIVPGVDWGYDLTGVAKEPLALPGVVYSVHPYPRRRPEPWPERWEQDWGYVKAQHPVFAVEFGFDRNEQRLPWGADSRYGKIIVDYLEKKGISWTAWCFDPQWAPSLIQDWQFTPTEEGTLFKAALAQAGTARRKP